MPTRIDIELTSSRGDGTWTWRAAGARQPKGVVDGALLATGAKVGDVLRADAEMDLDGINILAVTAPKPKRDDTDRLEVIGPPRTFTPVTSTIANFRDRDSERGRERGPRRPGAGPGGLRPVPGERRDPKAAGRGAPGPRGDREVLTPRPGTAQRNATAQGAGARGADRGGPLSRGDRPDGPRRGRGERTPPSPGGREAGSGRAERLERRPGPRTRAGSGGAGSPGRLNGTQPAAERPRPKRIQPGRAHRDALLASLAPQERLVADQVLRGGMSSVRQAIETQNAAARAAGEPEVRADALFAVAEELVPRLRAAEWRDRAEAAIGDVEAIGLRDLRAVVSGADAAARDDEARALAVRLREALERRTAEERQRWLDEITAALDTGRIVRALRLSARPPDARTRFPRELFERLETAAGAALGPEAAPDRWMAVLEGVLASPVRRSVRPAGLPAEAPPEVLGAARAAAGRIPGLLQVLGLDRAPIPPPPRPRPPQSRRPPAPSGSPPLAEPGSGPTRPAPEFEAVAAPLVAGPDHVTEAPEPEPSPEPPVAATVSAPGSPPSAE